MVSNGLLVGPERVWQTIRSSFWPLPESDHPEAESAPIGMESLFATVPVTRICSNQKGKFFGYRIDNQNLFQFGGNVFLRPYRCPPRRSSRDLWTSRARCPVINCAVRDGAAQLLGQNCRGLLRVIGSHCYELSAMGLRLNQDIVSGLIVSSHM